MNDYFIRKKNNKKIMFGIVHNFVKIFVFDYSIDFHFDERHSDDYIECQNTFDTDRYYLNQ